MNSPTASEASTFIDQSLVEGSTQRLLDDFLIDDSETVVDAEFILPLLHQPSHSRVSIAILVSRISIFGINFLPVIVALCNISMDWIPATIPFVIFTSVPFIMVIFSHLTYRSRAKSFSKGDVVGVKRTAVLVEDPTTGEERWMLEKMQKATMESRWCILGSDIFCVLMLVLGIVVAAVTGRGEARNSQGVMWGIISMKIVML